MSAPALKAFFNIAKAWDLSVNEQRALLGWPAPSTFHKYKSGQAGTLAFVALSTDDSKRASELIEQAVSLDPQYVWAYAAANRRIGADSGQPDWPAQLQAADPGNAVPLLLAADRLVEPRVEAIVLHGPPLGTEEKVLASDPKWIVPGHDPAVFDRFPKVNDRIVEFR